MKKLIVVADWADDSLTCQEITSAVEGFLKQTEGSKISFVCSTPSTVNTAYLLAQIVETEERFGKPLETVVFENTDPRLQSTAGEDKARGAELLVIRLVSGIYILGPNAGYDFSLIKGKIDQAYLYKGFDRGSQFRSRDLYSRVSAHLMEGLEKEMELEEISADAVPALVGDYIGHIDNYGNMKTTIKGSDLKGKYRYGDEIVLKINGVTKSAVYADNLFGAGVGRLVIYPGSSGVKDDPYLEITVWRHFTENNPTTGVHEFNHPRAGMEIKVLK